MQLAAMIVFSVAERLGADLTVDDAVYYQAWYLISRGHFRAYSSLHGMPYLKINGEFLTYPLALLFRPILSQSTMLIFQDFCMVGAGAVGLIWILDVVRRPTWPARFPPWVAVSAYVWLVALNPWLYESIAWPWHYEPLDALILMLAAYFLEHRQWKRAAIFVLLGTLTGAVGAVLLSGLGIATFLGGRRWRRPGLIVLLVGVATLLVLTSLKLSQTIGEFNSLGSSGGSGASSAGPEIVRILRGVVAHPSRPLGLLWANRLNFYANLGPTGIIGLLTSWGFGVPLASLVLSGLASNPNLRLPSFQNAVVYPFLTFGSILLLRRAALVRRIPRSVSLGLAGVMAANAIFWAVFWLPQIPGEWLKVSRPAAAMLRHAIHTMPSNAEVVASTGIVGAFAQRQWVYQLGGAIYPVTARTVYFVVAPNQGIESVYVSEALSNVAYIADTLHATPVEHGYGVWVFRWVPPRGQRTFRIGTNHTSIPAWTAPGPVGTDVFSGVPADWLVASNGRAGYVVAEDYWRRGVGHYQADVRLSANVPVNVEVWNQTSNTLLARRSLPATNGLQDVSFGVDVARVVPNKTMSGGGLFKIRPVLPRPGNSIEIRVWSPGNGEVSVYQLGFRQV